MTTTQGPCQCTSCYCDREAATTDDNGIPVCDKCSTYMSLDTGDVVCGEATDDFASCHECHEAISWSGVLTSDAPGTSNYRGGSCECGDVWRCEDNGGSWDRYEYRP